MKKKEEIKVNYKHIFMGEGGVSKVKGVLSTSQDWPQKNYLRVGQRTHFGRQVANLVSWVLNSLLLSK